jgi:hypothetical protein
MNPRPLPVLRALGAACVVAAACAPPQVGLRLRFPSTESFLLASTARVEIYDGTGEPDAVCRALSVGQPAGLRTLQSTGKQDVCAFAAGLQIDAIDVGRKVLFADVDDATSTAILRGCAVVDVAATPDEALGDDDRARAEELDVVRFVEVQLATLPTYPADVEPTCADVDEKCAQKLSCTE